VSEDAQHILQRALLGEALDCADGTAVFVWNEDRNYVAVNEEACRLVGLPREELIGMAVGGLSPDNATGDIDRVRRAPIVRGSSNFTRRDGATVEIEWVTMKTRVAGLPYMVSLVWPAR
jgi:PAS domain S-box-containing protein